MTDSIQAALRRSGSSLEVVRGLLVLASVLVASTEALAAQTQDPAAVTGVAVLNTCGEITPSDGVIAGVVQDMESDIVLGGATVTAAWQMEGEPYPSSDAVRTDKAGFFVFCGIPGGVDAELNVELLEVHAGPRTILVEAGTLAIERFELPLSDSRSPGYVTGQVVSRVTGRGIPSALVTIPELEMRTTTNEQGLFYLQEMPFGVYEMTVRHIAHENREFPVRVAGGVTHNLHIELDEDVIELGGIEVSVESRRFFMDREGLISRMNLGFGDFYTRADIERFSTSSIAELLGRTAGVRVYDGGTSLYIRGRVCVPLVFVDGMPWQLDDRLGLKELSTYDADAIEFYKGTASIPAEFNYSTNATGEVGCGAIVIWTKRGRSG